MAGTIFDDEFHYTGIPDPTKWVIRTDRGYSASEVTVNGTSLVEGITRTAGARIQTFNPDIPGTIPLFQFQYGTASVNMKMPASGYGAIFWMEGVNILHQYQEIDVGEELGNPFTIDAGVASDTSVNPAIGGLRFYYSPVDLSAAFHTYTVKWVPNDIKMLIDGVQFAEFTPSNITGPWVFNNPCFLIISTSHQGGSGSSQAVVNWARVTQP